MTLRALSIVAMTVLLGGQVSAQALVTFGKPSAVSGADEFGLPTPEQLFLVQSEHALQQRLRQELSNVKQVDFPTDAPLPEVSREFTPYPEQIVSPIVDPVCYRPLYFEAKRTERFGKYVPCVQPLLSAGRFYGDVVILPCRLLWTPPWTYECDNR